MATAASTAPGDAGASVAVARPRLYLLSPLPPQRNGLADYIEQYLEPLARDHELVLVAESGVAPQVAAHFAGRPFEVIDEARFCARMPDPRAHILYNLGNNRDCIFLLDYIHRYPGTLILHDISLFFLHQIALQQQRANGMMARLLQEDACPLPDVFLKSDGSLASSPGIAYQECLMLRRIVVSAHAVVVHSAYARRRALGAVTDPARPGGLAHKFLQMPHFVLPAPDIAAAASAATLARWGVRDGDFLLVVPGFLTGNKMLYEVLVAYHRALRSHPQLRLIFAGDERADEYPISDKIRQLFPQGDGPLVTGYLGSDELDILLHRADLSFVLRFPTYGEASGILPRAVMGGGRVVTVDSGAYPEFESALIERAPVGPGLVDFLVGSIERAIAARATDGPRVLRQAEARRRTAALSPVALYPMLRAAIAQAARPATSGRPEAQPA